MDNLSLPQQDGRGTKRPPENPKNDERSVRDPKKLRSSYTNLVSITFEGKTSMVYEDIINPNVPWLEKTQVKQDQRSEFSTISLDWSPCYTSARAVQIFIEWLSGHTDIDLYVLAKTYANDLMQPYDAPDDEPILYMDEEIKPKSAGLALCRLWVLGDFLEDDGFKDDVIRCLFTKLQEWKAHVYFEALRFVWDTLGQRSKLTRLVIDWILPKVSRQWIKYRENKLDQDCLMFLLGECIDRLQIHGGEIPFLEDCDIIDYLEDLET